MILSIDGLRKMTVFPIVMTALIAGVVIYLAPKFSEIFEAFGTELPLLTRIFVGGYWGVAILPVFAVTGSVFTKKGSRARGMITFWSIFLSWVILLPAFVAAMYLPFMVLAEKGG